MIHPRIWLFVFSIVFAASGLAQPSQADERLLLKRGAFGPDRNFIIDYVKRNFDGARTDRNSLYIGRHDINGDGQPELFVYLFDFGWCGVVGCSTPIFQKRNGQWQYLAHLTVTQDGYADDKFLFARQEPGREYKTLYSDYYGIRWNGREYEGFCRRDCDHTEGNEALKEWFRKNPR